MKHKYLDNVATLSLSPAKCVGYEKCGKCTEVCPHGVFMLEGSHAAILDKNSCMECGACTKNCPANAISVNAGTGCAFAVIMGWLTGSEPNCDCGSSKCC